MPLLGKFLRISNFYPHNLASEPTFHLFLRNFLLQLTWISEFRAYDRAAIKFRGVDADINFNLSDYEEDLKQVGKRTSLISMNLGGVFISFSLFT